MKPQLLDLFCGAGGAGMGYHLAGFEVVGVDINPQPNYPFRFVQADANTYPLDGFDAVAASPPCTEHTSMKTTGTSTGTGWMLAATLQRLATSGLPYVVENVPRAKSQMPGAQVVCGKSLGLAPLKRHRLFVTNFPVTVPACTCKRDDDVVGVYGDLTQKDRRATGIERPKHTIRASVHTARRLMECPWMAPKELSQAIPPRYTQLIGEQLMTHLDNRRELVTTVTETNPSAGVS